MAHDRAGSNAVRGWTRSGRAQDAELPASLERWGPSPALLRQLVEASTEAMLVLQGGCLRYANLAARRLLGDEARDVIGLEFARLVHPGDRDGALAMLVRTRASGVERVLATHDGVAVPVEMTLVPSEDEPDVVYAFFRDSSERKALLVELERANRLESLGRLAGSVAHDFNNLLTGIRGSLALARAHFDDPLEQELAIDAADAASMRAAEVTRQLLSFSRGPDVGAGEIDPEAVVSEVVDLLARFKRHEVQLLVTVEPGLGAVRIAASQLHQVLLNLLLNAQDAIDGSGAIQVRLRHTKRARDGSTRQSRFIECTVEDSGRGMDTGTRRRLFEPFFTTKPAGEGTGLGLSTVYGIVKQAGGWLEVESEPGRGTTFRVFLPVVSGDEAPMGIEEDRATAGGHVRTVLVCDDETRLATLTAGLLEEYGFGALTVASGDEALEVFARASQQVDLLLLDVNLASGPTAREILGSLEERRIGVPVILTSGFAAEDVPVQLREHPRVTGYLAKPYSVDDLVESIKLGIERSRESVLPVSGRRARPPTE